MLTRKSPFKARPVTNKKKLSQLFEDHSIDPDQIYVFKAVTAAKQSSNNKYQHQHQEQQQENNNIYNYIPQTSSNKKAVGLFANIIKNMEQTKGINRVEPPTIKQQNKMTYQYYFNQFELKANKNKKQKQAIELESNQILTHDQQHYFTQIQLRNNKQQLQQEAVDLIYQNEKNTEIKGKTIDNFVDMNFSFDDIGKQLTSIKEKTDKQHSRIQEDTIIKKFLEENSKNSFFDGELNFGNSLKQQKMAKIQSIQKKILRQSNKGKISNFTKLSKQAKGAHNQLIPPFFAKKFAAKNSSSKDLHPIFSLEGTKKVESRIVGNDSKNEPNSINIDFDLDINFI